MARLTMNTMAMTMAALVALGATTRAQSDEVRPGELKGKVGRAIEARGDPEIAPRPVVLDRLNLPEDVKVAFLEKLEERLDDDQLELLRAQKIERMQRKLGTTREEALAIREDFDLDPRPEAKAPAKKVKVVEEESESGLWLVLGGITALCGYVIVRMRRG